MSERNSFALLIDCDNVSARYIPAIMNELAGRHGQVTYRRVYGDWTSPQMAKWKDALSEYSLTPMQQFPNTKGKNATDSFLIIDAMDILYEGKVGGFCIVSSDGDFTRLASRLRDAGMVVVGMGEDKTPRSFRNACTVFTSLQLISNAEDAGKASASGQEAPVSKQEIHSAIVDIVNEGSGSQVTLSHIGNRLVAIYPDFDVRYFGYSQLSKFLESFDNLNLKRQNNQVFVSLRESSESRQKLEGLVQSEVRKGGASGVPLSVVGDAIHNHFPNFNVKDYGYSKLSKYVGSIPGVQVSKTKNGPTVRPKKS